MEITLKIKKLKNCTGMPAYQTEEAAGMDLRAGITEEIAILPMERKLVPTGIAVELPKGYEAQLRPRSGLAVKYGITLINCVGTIDSDYRGEVCVGLINLSNDVYIVTPGERIAQMIVAPVVRVEITEVKDLQETPRSVGGFGSTGKQ